MANFTGQSGAELSNELAAYLNNNQGNLTSEQITNIINKYLSGGDKLAPQGGQIQTGVYKRFGEFDQINGKVEIVTTGIWTGDTGSLTSFFTSSTQTAVDYYLNVYDKIPTDSTSTIQFAVSYGHKEGSGSVSLANDDDATLPTKATYTQYKSLLLDQDDDYFTFISSSTQGTHDSDDIYIINIARSRYKEKVDPGNWSLTLSGSNGTFTLIDDSGKKYSDVVGKAGRVFNVVSGSLNLGTLSEATIENTVASNGEGYGLVYPDQGLLILNPSAIHALVGSSYDSASVSVSSPNLGIDQNYRNHYLLYNSIAGGGDFEARRTENISTSHYFVRATNREFNFSNNPTFTSGSDGTFRQRSFETDPKVYITTVGLLNDANEILAVAKTSQPIVKSFDKEVLIKVKLSF